MNELATMRGILFDMDGVLYNSDQAIAGAVETVGWVQSQGIPHLFVTNTTSRSRAVLVEKLASFGIPAAEQEILTPAAAAADWMRTYGASDIALFVRPSTAGEFAGLGVVETGASWVVVGDLGEYWDYRTLNRAFRLLYDNPEATLVALGMTRCWMAADGIALDVAPFIVALEHAAGRKARVFGKPAVAFFEAALARLGLAAGEVLMVGDDLEVDIEGAQAAGLKGALVKTGKFRPADLEATVRPGAVLDSVAELPAWWRESP